MHMPSCPPHAEATAQKALKYQFTLKEGRHPDFRGFWGQHGNVDQIIVHTHCI